MSPVPIPRRIHRGEREIVITWDEGHVARWPARRLRLECPCAACREEMTGRRLLDPDTVPEEVAAAGIALVGSYAIRVAWTDGHDSGIYPYEWLWTHCQCDACAGAERRRPPDPHG